MHKDDKRRVPSKIFILFAFSMFSKQRRLTTRATTTRATTTRATATRGAETMLAT